MDGNRFVATWHIHGTLSADAVIRYKLPCPATLVRVDTCGTADVHAALVIGVVGNTNAYKLTHTPGHNAEFVTLDRGDFDGDLAGLDTAECPHLAKDTELLLTWTHASSSDVDIALTFLEG
jgi:hypothetical protein